MKIVMDLIFIGFRRRFDHFDKNLDTNYFMCRVHPNELKIKLQMVKFNQYSYM